MSPTRRSFVKAMLAVPVVASYVWPVAAAPVFTDHRDPMQIMAALSLAFVAYLEGGYSVEECAKIVNTNSQPEDIAQVVNWIQSVTA